jgi:hypothetical protein
MALVSILLGATGAAAAPQHRLLSLLASVEVFVSLAHAWDHPSFIAFASGAALQIR